MTERQPDKGDKSVGSRHGPLPRAEIERILANAEARIADHTRTATAAGLSPAPPSSPNGMSHE